MGPEMRLERCLGRAQEMAAVRRTSLAKGTGALDIAGHRGSLSRGYVLSPGSRMGVRRARWGEMGGEEASSVKEIKSNRCRRSAGPG